MSTTTTTTTTARDQALSAAICDATLDLQSAQDTLDIASWLLEAPRSLAGVEYGRDAKAIMLTLAAHRLVANVGVSLGVAINPPSPGMP